MCFKKIAFLFVLCAAAYNCVQAQNLSNSGKEFWVGYGHNQFFTQGNAQDMTLYLSAEQAATVTVSINGTGYSNTINIPANTVNTSVILPKSGANDCRLLAEGLNTHGVHIVSDVPIVAYAHCTGSSSSGATLLLPVETYGNTYFSVNSEQRYGSNDCFSWFFVIASQNNTVVEITPSVLTRGGRAANTPFTVTLNKGEIYNVMGALQSSSVGFDLTGSKVRSIANSSGECLPIAVFSGSSRTYICGSGGGDYIIQQIFPASAWGTRYLTSPTVSTVGIGTNNPSIYRVAVRDPTTVVKRNGVVLTGIQRNFYYEFTSSTADYIEADKPILVAQYLVSTASCGSTGLGDPEMFYISPIEQAISRVGFYNTNKEAASITANTYVNIIVPSSSLSSLRIDGSSAFDRVYSHPQNSAYRVVIKKLSAPSQHIITSDSGFTAITYGLASVESYGYNAGTLVNNLDAVSAISNTLSQVGTSSYTCPNSPFKLSIKLTYKPTQMVWRFSQVSGIVPNADTTVVNPVAADSSVMGGRVYYEYRLPRDYTFADTGTYSIPIVVTAPQIDNCNNSTTVNYIAKVNAPPKPDFTFTYTGCKSDTAFLYGSFIGTTFNITRYRWFFDDGTTDSTQDTKKLFPTQGSHNVKLRVISDNGCVGDTIKPVVTSPPPMATFGMTPATSCVPATVTFTDTSSYAGGQIHNWYWDFGNGQTTNEATNAPQTQTYVSPGKYTIKHFAQSGSCRGDTAIKILTVYAKPVVDFTLPVGCLPDSIAQFINTTTVADSQAISYSWNFGDANANAANPNTSTIGNPTHKYTAYGTYNVTLTATTANGCSNSVTKAFTIGGFSPAIQYTIINDTALCVQKPVQLRNEVNIAGDSIYKVVIFWDYLNQPTDSVIDNNPAQNAVYAHSYPSFTAPATLSFTVKVVVYSRGGCVSERLKQITLHAAPVVAFAPLADVCINSPAVSIALGTVTNGITGSGVYSGAGTTAAGMFDPTAAGVGSHTITYIFTTAAGCKDSATQQIIVSPKPIVKWGFVNLCDSTQFRDSSIITTGAITTWSWTFGDNTSAVRNNPSPFNKLYSAAGTYNSSLVVTSDKGCKSDSLVKAIVVNPLPVPAFSIAHQDSLCSSNAVQLTNITNPGGDTISKLEIYWDVANQPTTFQTISNPAVNAVFTHQYAAFTSPATRSVTIKWIIYARNGCASEITRTITLHATPQLVFPAVPSVCINSAPVSIAIASATNVSGTGVYKGPGTLANGMFNPATAGVGSHTITYVFTTAGGCIDSASSIIKVMPKPVAKFGFTAVCEKDSTLFIDSSLISSGSIRTWQWNFGDGANASNASGASFRHLYPTYNTYNATLTVVSDSGCASDPVTREVLVNALPVTDFGLPIAVCMPGGLLRLNNLTSVPNGSSSSVNYVWNFGDGSATSTVTNPTHAYATAGTYNIQLTATSAAGCVKDTTKTFSAFYNAPTADFAISDTSICQGIQTKFFDSSVAASSSISQWLWSFGDGSTSTIENPAKTYASPGLYAVKLTVTTPQGCKADTTKTVRVYLQPIVDAGPNQVIPEGTLIQMQPVVNDTTLRFLWTPSLYLNSDTILRPVLRPLFNQTYMLSATGDGNCTASDTVRITVLKPLHVPNAFSPNGDGINDTWQIPYLADYPGNVVEVFNRYGQMVYRVEGYNKAWDGTINGKPLPVGVYYYIINLRQDRYPQITGPLTILK